MYGFYLQIDSVLPITSFIILISVFSILYLFLLHSLRIKRRIAINNVKGKITYGALKNQNCLNGIEYKKFLNDNPNATVKDFKKSIDDEINSLLKSYPTDRVGNTVDLMRMLMDTEMFEKFSLDSSNQDKSSDVLNYSFYTILKIRYLNEDTNAEEKKNAKTYLRKIDQLRTQEIQTINQEIDLFEFKRKEMAGQMCK